LFIRVIYSTSFIFAKYFKFSHSINVQSETDRMHLLFAKQFKGYRKFFERTIALLSKLFVYLVLLILLSFYLSCIKALFNLLY